MDLTLASVDHIRNLLDEENSSKDRSADKRIKNLLARISTIIESKSQPAEEKTKVTVPESGWDKNISI